MVEISSRKGVGGGLELFLGYPISNKTSVRVVLAGAAIIATAFHL